MRASTPQLERVGFPSAHSSVGRNRHQHRHARCARDRNLRERNALNTCSVRVSGQLSQHGTLHQVNGAKTSLSSTADGNSRSRVDGKTVDTTIETETSVGGEKLVDGFSGTRVPEDEHRIFGAGDDLLACDSARERSEYEFLGFEVMKSVPSGVKRPHVTEAM